ncbi:hypothetical protein [uncultured Litoreibacter sp.]|uniref:hypothetical protein n=1 Tax=uncultured Litoreibacter sp. TaxID=1392394 RepID=UPI00262F66B2|nr:hypothetical protein [uncultured Litoreibacter sp.]
MNTKIILAALALTLAPSIASAMGCNGGDHKQAASCAAGASWDADLGKCVSDATG